MEDLPDELRDVLDQLRRREFSVNLRHQGLDRLNDDTLEHASGTIAVGMVIAGLLVGSSVLILAERGMKARRFCASASVSLESCRDSDSATIIAADQVDSTSEMIGLTSTWQSRSSIGWNALVIYFGFSPVPPECRPVSELRENE